MSKIQNDYLEKTTNKQQILLFDTKRRYTEYSKKIENRKKIEIDDIPHFIILKNGDIINFFDSDICLKTFYNKNIDNRLIKIAFENLGWLQKNTITGVYNNWIGDIYRSEPYISSWRNYFFWDPYTEKQIKSVIEITNKLCEKYNIPFEYININNLDENITKKNGIACKSNYAIHYTDINPSFNFILNN